MDFISDKFYNKAFWLPKDCSWEQMYKYTGINLTQYFFQCIALSIVISVVRMVFEKWIGYPIGAFFGVPGKKECKPNPTLEKLYIDQKQTLNSSVAMMISKDVKMDYEEVCAWFLARQALNKPSQLQKFSESCWRFVFYSVVWSYGVYILKDKEWIWDTNHNWVNYPRQEITADVYYYYTIEIAFYYSLLVSQFTDIKRKDFWQMFIHHIVTLMLLNFSILTNFARIGSIVLVLHDTVDWMLELAKMGKYANNSWVSDPVFGVFTISWAATRLYLYPGKVIKSILFEAHDHLEATPAYWFLTVLLCVLQVMHVIWFWIIWGIAWKGLTGVDMKDDRSDFSEELDLHEHKD